MLIDNQAYRSIWREQQTIKVIDQTELPFVVRIAELNTVTDAAQAIRNMVVRGAPLIGVTAAYGMALALQANASDESMRRAYEQLLGTRPTAVNLRWALDRVVQACQPVATNARAEFVWTLADSIATEDIELNAGIGKHGLPMIESLHQKKRHEQDAVNLLTHCNAGWLATVDWGTVTSPMYQAHAKNIPMHVWVDETRPRNQGAITAWELSQQGIDNTYIVDNAGGLLMQQGRVDAVIVGCDRVAANGDVCNKIGTYLKALAAQAHNVPFYVATPSPTIDWTLASGDLIPIEERDALEVHEIRGQDVHAENTLAKTANEKAMNAKAMNAKAKDGLRVTANGTKAMNLGFDITPAKLVTGYITEKGIVNTINELK